MNKNILCCAAGIIAGLVIGFFAANATGTSSSTRTSPSSVAQGGGGGGDATTSARPLDPSETELPPDHPSIDGAGSAASSSPQAQAAMERADRNLKDFDAQREAAATFYQLGAYDKAALYLERALKLRPEDVDTLTAIGNVKYDRGDYLGAASFYERSLALKPDDPDVRTDLGNTFFQRQPPDYDRAIAEYRRSIAVDPRHEKSWQNIAAAAIQKRDKTTARQAVERLAAINPQNPALASLRRSIEGLP